MIFSFSRAISGAMNIMAHKLLNSFLFMFVDYLESFASLRSASRFARSIKTSKVCL